MKCIILHESPGRLRVHMNQYRMSFDQADILEQYLNGIDGVIQATVSDRTCNAIIVFDTDRQNITEALSVFQYDDCAIVPNEHNGRATNRAFQEKLFWHIANRLIRKLFLPRPVRAFITICKSVPYLMKGIESLWHGRIEVPLLDATSIGVSLATGDFDTAGSVIFLLGLGDILDEWNHRKSVETLARSMSLNIDRVWIRAHNGEEVLVNISQVSEGSEIIVRTSNTIPLDGMVIEGEISVNQSSMTGESVPVRKEAGSPVYAGTVVEEGECIYKVTQSAGEGRYDRIIRMIEESEKLKSETESRAAHLADHLVPYSFLATLLTYLFTRDPGRATAVLMVDYSCALKLSMPISVLSAMRECSEHHISVKGGKFLENTAAADTIVFDKTGTLTYSKPTVAAVIPFGDNDENEMLRLAACLEEHYPHSIANAVVAEAKRRGLDHEEKHSRVQYVVAHGISSTVDGEDVIIGSYHFVFEDEKYTIDQRDRQLFDSLPEEYSHLYLGIGRKLAAVILIEDPIRKEAPSVIEHLHAKGLKHIVMMTGDSERTAASAARKVGVDEYYSEVLPEDKAAYITKQHTKGRKVIMLGDGINDSPALAEADCGIAVSDGAAIAREIADITISDDNLTSLLTLKEIADGLDERIRRNYRFIMSFNTGLILLGIFGILPATTTALLHNTSTIAISLKSMTDLIPQKRSAKN